MCAAPIADATWEQITLPGPLAGCGLRPPSALLDAALWSSWHAHESSARALSAQLGRVSDHTVADADAADAAAALEASGTLVRANRAPELTLQARAEIEATPWAPELQADRADRQRRPLGGILRLCECLRIARLWQASDAATRTRLLSAGGPQTGMTWSALPDTGQKHIPDEHWRVITAERLGLLRCPPGTPCGLPRGSKRGGVCGKALDSGLRHMWHCKTGVARLRIHNAIAGTLAGELRTAGGHVDVERAMPAMAIFNTDGTVEEAIMDVTVWWPGAMEWYGIDVTVRYAGSTRYVGAQRKAGKAAAAAEAEKYRRYGRDVLPLAFEAGGRLGTASIASLQRLADAAVAASGGILNRTALLARWRRRLEGALFFATADAILCALGRSQKGAQLAARWAATTPAPLPLTHHLDGCVPAAPTAVAAGTEPAPAASTATAAGAPLSATRAAADFSAAILTGDPSTGDGGSDADLFAESCLAEGLAALLEDDPEGWSTHADSD